MFRQPHRFFKPKSSAWKRQRRNYGVPLPGKGPAIGLGLLLVSLGIPVLVINERRAVRQDQLREKGEQICLEMDVDTPQNLPSYNQTLVHAVGHVGANGATLQDQQFKVQKVDDPVPLRIVRKVNMYQWKETRHERKEKDEKGNEVTTVTYSYGKVWSDTDQSFEGPDPPPSVAFPPHIPGGETHFKVPWFVFGKQKYQLSPVLEDQVMDFIPMPIDNTNCKYDGSDLQITQNGLYTKGGDINSPNIGDISIQYEYVPEGTHTTISKFDHSMFCPYKAVLKKKLSEEGEIKAPQETSQITGTNEPLIIPEWAIEMAEGFVLMIAPVHLAWVARGRFDMHQSFAAIHEENEKTTSFFRIAGSVMVVVGCVLAVQVLPFFTAAKNAGAIVTGVGIAFQTIQDAKTASHRLRSTPLEDI